MIATFVFVICLVILVCSFILFKYFDAAGEILKFDKEGDKVKEDDYMTSIYKSIKNLKGNKK